MRSILALLLLLSHTSFAAEPEFPLTEDSKPQPNVPKGTLLKDTYIAAEGSVFPGTGREYQIYLPAGLDKTKPAAFMVFQDGVIYQAPVVFDNLIAKQDIPPLVGIFIKPGVVAAASDKALPRFNRSYEYDSVTPTYSQFLLDEFLPAIQKKHDLKLSTDPNLTAISGNSSGGICAFMVAWHRPDRFRRVFTGVGTYVGIHGADQLPVLVRKFEPKPLRVFLQSGTGDNNLYCGDWWMANQTMERSLTWAGYDVNHAWGEGGHNAKHASQIFPDVLRWLWRDWQTSIEIKANAKGESKWKGYEVVGEGEWEQVWKTAPDSTYGASFLASNITGGVYANEPFTGNIWELTADAPPTILFNSGPRTTKGGVFNTMAVTRTGGLASIDEYAMANFGITIANGKHLKSFEVEGDYVSGNSLCISHDDWMFVSIAHGGFAITGYPLLNPTRKDFSRRMMTKERIVKMALCPDQTQLYGVADQGRKIWCYNIGENHSLTHDQAFDFLETDDDGKTHASGLCVDTNGWLYVATSLGIQVCDQAGRVNFIIPTPKEARDVCFGGKDLSDLFIACGDAIYKRPTKAHGIVSGQMAPIKPPTPKL